MYRTFAVSGGRERDTPTTVVSREDSAKRGGKRLKAKYIPRIFVSMYQHERRRVVKKSRLFIKSR